MKPLMLEINRQVRTRLRAHLKSSVKYQLYWQLGSRLEIPMWDQLDQVVLGMTIRMRGTL